MASIIMKRGGAGSSSSTPFQQWRLVTLVGGLVCCGSPALGFLTPTLSGIGVTALCTYGIGARICLAPEVRHPWNGIEPRKVTPRPLQLWAEGSSGQGDAAAAAGDEEDELRGKERRALRALAGRKKAEKSLFTVQQGETVPSDVWVRELGVALKAHELVNIRAHCAPTKKETKRIGEIIAAQAEAELVQVIGHTYLLYKPGNPPKIDLAKMTAPAPPSPPAQDRR